MSHGAENHSVEKIAKKSISDTFVHLHLHSVYSLLDGAIPIKDLIAHVKAEGMTSVAITDHGNMFGAVDFYSEAISQGIKPILGCEFYVASSRFERKAKDEINDGGAYHFVLLAKNKIGYKNLSILSSKSYTEGFYRKPRIDYELLAKHSEGLIGLSGCLAGEINRKILRQDTKEALNLAGYLNEIMGKDNFYLELQRHGIPEQDICSKEIIEIHKKTNIPLILTNDAHFLKREDRDAQDIMLRIQMQKKIDEVINFGFNEEFYVKSALEMKQLFPDHLEAFYNTQKIADMVDLQMEFGTPLLPRFETPENISLADYLEKLSFEGLKSKFKESEVPREYLDRLKTELEVIGRMNFDGYFLIVSDFISYAKQNGIPVGPGRGSAAGSMVAYSLGITDIDPIKYGLLFERFLNPSRNEMPDIDIDFCRDRREEVISYVVNKYGADHVSQIITFGRLSAKAVIKDVARVLGFDFSEINNVCKAVPNTPGISLDDAVTETQELKKFFARGEQEKKLWRIAKTLEGLPRHAGKHAAGLVIAPSKLEEIIPLAVDTKTGAVMSQYDKGPLEKVGLVKMDLLGLKNLTIIQKTLNEIKRRHNKEVPIDKLPLDDESVFKLLQKGQTSGIFQVENHGMTKMLTRAKPQKFEDIIACIALYRPGPLQSGMTEEYIKRRNGEVKVTYPHNDLANILKETYGTIVYQEQVMLISQIIGGFSMAEADTLRKAMGKKKQDVMDKLKTDFMKGAKAKGHNEKWASDLFDMMAEFGKYGFNKSHSAAYGMITYQTAYLKAHFTIEFIKANLDADIETPEKLISSIRTAREMGIEVLPPDINESDLYFTIIDDKKIRYGLLALKGLGRTAVEVILKAREQGSFQNIFDFAKRVDSKYFNKKTFESLTFSGATDCFNKSRAALYDNLENILSFGSREQQDKSIGQEVLFQDSDTASIVGEIQDKEEWSSDRKLMLEKQIIGFYLNSHPVDMYKDMIDFSNITYIDDIDDGVSKERLINILGVIEKIKMVTPKRGNAFYSLTVSDISGEIEVRVYNSLYQKSIDYIVENGVVLMNIKATIHRDENMVNIIFTANSFSAVEEIENMVEKSLHIHLLSSKNLSLREQISNLKETLKKFPGKVPVFIHYKDHQSDIQVVRVHPMYFVNNSPELSDKLTEILISARHFAWRIGDKVYIDEKERKAI
ncbi:MAG: DNA polymerase III subunit alpha [Spirochaetia bacterium]|nr:DNA polymerase III subunit alpha [Spirochaetia bacterium]